MPDLPPLPPGLTRNQFGRHVMQWGTGYEAAVARINTITRKWLIHHGVTREMVRQWQHFYERVYAIDPENHSAEGRIELMRYCVGLFDE